MTLEIGTAGSIMLLRVISCWMFTSSSRNRREMWRLEHRPAAKCCGTPLYRGKDFPDLVDEAIWNLISSVGCNEPMALFAAVSSPLVPRDRGNPVGSNCKRSSPMRQIRSQLRLRCRSCEIGYRALRLDELVLADSFAIAHCALGLGRNGRFQIRASLSARRGICSAL